MFNFKVANDNGNSEHKMIIDGEVIKQPNVYKVFTGEQPQTDETIQKLVEDLNNNILVKIESKSLGTEAFRYLVGNSALSTSKGRVKNMNIEKNKKHEEKLPLINTLGLIGSQAIKRKFAENETIADGTTIPVVVDMTTAIPASVYKKSNADQFESMFTDSLHELRFYIKDISVNVQITFRFVKVTQEGVPALFSIIENGEGKFRNDDLFDEFKEEYSYEKVTGKHFSDKKILHLDIGEGTTELTYTQGYAAHAAKSSGVPLGIGQAIQTATDLFNEGEDLNFSRQLFSNHLKNPLSDYHEEAILYLNQSKQVVAQDLLDEVENKVREINADLEVLVVYGGASILLKDSLYEKLVNLGKKRKFEVLWVPEKYAVEMNVQGMHIFNTIKLEQLVKEAQKNQGDTITSK